MRRLGPDSVCGVVVAYRPHAAVADNLAAIREQMPLVVVANAPEARPGGQEADLDALAHELDFALLANRVNLGQAAALNQGLDWARRQGFTAACLFDQDSRPRPGYLARMLELWPQLPGRVAVLGCNYEARIRHPEGERLKIGFPCPPAEPVFEHVTAITAGSLLDLQTAAEVGPFREVFFIDHVDHDYCLRARGKGLGVFVAAERLLEHSIGAISYHRFLGRWLETSNHSAQRRYYWHRNAGLLLREHWHREPAWCFSILCWFMPTGLVNLLLFERRRGVKLRAVLLGLFDALRKREGRRRIGD